MILIPCNEENCDGYDGEEDMSGMWKGSGYYRFMEPSGIMMPESFPGYYHCGTNYPGWLNGTHPEEVGLEVEREAHFDVGSSDVYVNISVTKCNGGYYVYHLVHTL